MTWFQAFILGAVQGVTEFLPVSSSGHLVMFQTLLGVEEEGGLVFEVVRRLEERDEDQAQLARSLGVSRRRIERAFRTEGR